MKKIIRIISLLLITISTISLFGCFDQKDSSSDSSNGNNEQQFNGITVNNDQPKSTVSDYEDHFITENTLHNVKVAESNVVFVENGKTEYSIVIGSGNIVNQNEKIEAGSFIAKQVRLATGADLKMITADQAGKWTTDSKYIVLDDKEMFEAAGLTMPDVYYGYTGYYIKSVGNSIFIATKHNFGYQQAAISFLTHVIGLDVYSNDTIHYFKDGKYLPNMDIVERPDFEIYQNGTSSLTSEMIYAMGFVPPEDVFMPLGGELWHNVLDVLPRATYRDSHPNWYAPTSPETICYTARLAPEEREDDKLYDSEGNPQNEYAALVVEVANKITSACITYPNHIAVTFSMEDCAPACNCEECIKEKENYNGANAASVVKFMNDVDNLVQAWIAENQEGRELYLLFFAYQVYAKAPVKTVDGVVQPIDDSVICNPHVAPYVALLDDSYYNESYYHEKNQVPYNSVVGWSKLCKGSFLWPYQTNFHSAMFPFNTYDTFQETYRLLKHSNALYVKTEGCWFQSATSSFERLKVYVDSKMMKDLNVNITEVMDNFFDNYFGPASAPMRKYFDELQAYLCWLEQEYPTVFTGYIYEEVKDAKYWPKQTMNHWLSIMDEAYKAIEKYKEIDPELYTRLKNHITLETIFPRFVLLFYYEGTYSPNELQQMRVAFKEDCEAFGIHTTSTGGGEQLSDLYIKWGIA